MVTVLSRGSLFPDKPRERPTRSTAARRALKTVAYLRVSTRSQDLANQKLAILEFSQKRRFPIDQFIESRISSRQSPLERRIDDGLEGSEKRAREAARTDGISVRYGWRRDQFDTFKYSMLEERLEQVREIDGELAYGKMRRALEKASQEKARQARQVERARQVESARLERAMQETARQSRGRRGLERGGPERDFGPSR